MFLGQYHLSVDDKGRVSVPAGIRHTLHELYAPHDTTLVVTKFFEHCLVLYPQTEWLAVQEQVATLPNDESCRAFQRLFYASAHLCPLDRQGRLLIPPKLRDYAAIETEACLVGLRQKLELWSPQRWEGYEAREMPRFDTNDHVKALRL